MTTHNKEGEQYFYYKNSSRKITPFPDRKSQNIAKDKLLDIKNNYFDSIPSEFKEEWDKVKLFHPAGDVDKAHSLILQPEEGAYDLKNKLNHLTGKEWTKFTCSWFIFNALKKDLAEEKAISKNSDEHPATYSPTMISEFVNFFTKEGQKVLDPFCGIGSTLVACKRTGRVGYGTELNEKYFTITKKRVPEFESNIHNTDCRNLAKIFDKDSFDFSISSPPYWDVLNRSTKDFKKKREEGGLDYNYSTENQDLGNIEDYNYFLESLTNIYLDIHKLLKKGAYIVIIVKNIKKGGKMYPLAWDLARNLSSLYVLKDEKLWIQDKVGLAPYGYPSSWASNILHHYCLILRKE